MSDERRCQHITYTPIYATHIGSVRIDPSEYATTEGAHLWDDETHCNYIADPGHKFCPRHEMELLLKTEAA